MRPKERGSPAPLQREKLANQERIYNQHVRLLSSEPFGGLRFQSLLGACEPTLLWNHYTQNPPNRKIEYQSVSDKWSLANAVRKVEFKLLHVKLMLWIYRMEFTSAFRPVSIRTSTPSYEYLSLRDL
jgi:hypothetical protein